MNETFWSRMFLVAALWNLVIGLGIMVFPEWSYTLAYVTADDGMSDAVGRLWWDFGLSVVIIGIGYYLVSRDISKNHGIVWVGLLAKLLVDVLGITHRYIEGSASSVALILAAGDGVFAVLFGVFLVKVRQRAISTT